MLQQIYSALPISLQHACATAQGAKILLLAVWRDIPGISGNAEAHRVLASGRIARTAKAELETVPANLSLCTYRTIGNTARQAFTTKDQIRERPEDFIADTFRGGR
jgi:hypothetical protein